ncbi:MAG: hypothetical protein P1U56_24265 [Saprospiraceae bacterium]|nr:hypothetical protein [Saprospiraceae bacterium]
MKKITILLFLNLLFFTPQLDAQYIFTANATKHSADLKVCYNKPNVQPDISVLIAEEMVNETFSVGFTDSKEQADVIITNELDKSDISIVDTPAKDANLSIYFGDALSSPDVGIKVVENGTVDILVFNETMSLSPEKLISALLPIINASLDYKFEQIPIWGKEENETQEPQTLEPTYYAGINTARWIENIEDGVIQLDDNSIFYVYDDDRYISKLWTKMNDIVVSPTEVPGHYYLQKDGGIYKDAETLRAICVKGN